MDGEELVATAARLAAVAHVGTVDKFGRPYFDGHVAEVAGAVAQSAPRPSWSPPPTSTTPSRKPI